MTPEQTFGQLLGLGKSSKGVEARAFGWWMERADEKGVKETARHKPLKMLSYVGEYT